MKNNLLKYLLPVAIVTIAVLLYIFIPSINAWVLRISEGWQGAVFLLGAGIVLAVYYTWVMRFRGRAFIYAIGVIVFTAMCIWLLANHEWFFDLLQTHLGTWGMIGVLLVLCAILALGIMCL